MCSSWCWLWFQPSLILKCMNMLSPPNIGVSVWTEVTKMLFRNTLDVKITQMKVVSPGQSDPVNMTPLVRGNKKHFFFLRHLGKSKKSTWYWVIHFHRYNLVRVGRSCWFWCVQFSRARIKEHHLFATHMLHLGLLQFHVVVSSVKRIRNVEGSMFGRDTVRSEHLEEVAIDIVVSIGFLRPIRVETSSFLSGRWGR